MSSRSTVKLDSSIRLAFRSIDGSIPSAASLALHADERRGIYLYEFTDGTAYVGRSIDMARRLSDHRHDYRHDPRKPEIRQAQFAPVSDDVSVAELDEIETRAISTGLSSMGLILSMSSRSTGPEDLLTLLSYWTMERHLSFPGIEPSGQICLSPQRSQRLPNPSRSAIAVSWPLLH